jgi:peptidyl-prolyl cis-trans isomerase D
MLGFFRSIFHSKIGVGITLGFLVLIALAFASADITGASFGGIAGGDRVATVGDQRIGSAELTKAVNGAFERTREQSPGLTIQRFVASGAIGQVLDDMIDRSGLFEFGRRHGISASDRLVDSEIVKIPAFQGPDGRFDEDAYRRLLGQQGLTDQMIRDDIAQGLVAKQLMVPVAFGAQVPASLAQRYASLTKERRTGQIVLLPSQAFAPTSRPGPDVLAAFYAAHRASYTRPERRVIRYASFGEDAVKAVPAPNDAEVAKAYAANRQAYAPSETRTVTQVVLPTEAAARAVAGEVAKGTPLATAAKSKGLLPSTASFTREALTAQTSPALSEAVFSAKSGALAGPARSALGWHLAHVDAITAKPGKTLEQARGEIAEQLATAKRHAALSDLSAKLEDQLDKGASLADVAKDMGLTVTATAPLLANGQLFGQPGKTAPPEIARVVPTAFQMEREGQPQVAEVEAGKRFVLFDVGQITPAAPPPLAEIQPQVAQDWALSQGSDKARAAAGQVIAALSRGTPLPQAIAGLGVKLPPAQTVDTTRQLLLTTTKGQVPPTMALLFSMARGTAKPLQGAGNQSWYVVRLDSIVPGAVNADDPQLPAVRRELALLTGREYADEFRRAVRAEVGAKRNQAAINAVTRQLVGEGQ